MCKMQKQKQNKTNQKLFQCCWLSVKCYILMLLIKMTRLRNSFRANTRWLIQNVNIFNAFFVCAVAVQCICGGIWGISNDPLQVRLHQHLILAHLPCQHSCGDRCHCHMRVFPWIFGQPERESMHAHQCKYEAMLIIDILLIFILDYAQSYTGSPPKLAFISMKRGLSI